MTKTRLCRLCGQPLELHGSRTARLTLCDDCRARILSRYTYRIEHHITGKENCCLVCGNPIPKGYNGYTTCSRACRTLLNSVTASYRKNKAANQLRQDKQEHPEAYLPPKRVLSPLGRAEQDAREQGLTYGLYMARKIGRGGTI